MKVEQDLPPTEDSGSSTSQGRRPLTREETLQVLAALDPEDYADERKKAARELGMTLTMLDAAVAKRRRQARAKGNRAKDGQGRYGEHWLAACLTDLRGDPLQNTSNVLLALNNDPALVGLLAYDEMRRTTLLMHPVPEFGQPADTRPGFTPVPMQDHDIVALQVWLQRAGLASIASKVVSDAARLRSRERAFHPVRDYLNGLVWDGTMRLGVWLTDYCGVALTAYSQAVARMTLIALVARVMSPGCKADHMLILEGPQGIGKSTVCKILGGAYFSDALPEVSSGKDVSLHLRDKWVIEISEMSALNRAEAAALKAFLTRTFEFYRPPYGECEVYEPRQMIFIGTTNKEAYLRDETGGRRFWPVKVGRLEHEALARDRDQLLAEAVALYRDGAQWWPDEAFERAHFKPQQEARFESDAWESDIAEWLSEQRMRAVTLSEVAYGALGIEKKEFQKAKQGIVAGLMERCGWVRANDGKPDPKTNKRLWVPGANPAQP